MKRSTVEYSVFDGVTPVAVTSSTDATPIVVTATAHGLVTGDAVGIYGHTTNIAANGVFRVTKLTADTFSLTDINTGASVAGSGAGAGASGVLVKNPKVILAEDFAIADFTLDTAGTTTATIKFAGSNGKLLANTTTHGDTPNFGATQAQGNPYSFMDFVSLSGGGAIVDGDTGVVIAGTDVHETYEVNVNGVKYLYPLVASWTQGSIDLKVKLFNRN